MSLLGRLPGMWVSVFPEAGTILKQLRRGKIHAGLGETQSAALSSALLPSDSFTLGQELVKPVSFRNFRGLARGACWASWVRGPVGRPRSAWRRPHMHLLLSSRPPLLPDFWILKGSSGGTRKVEPPHTAETRWLADGPRVSSAPQSSVALLQKHGELGCQAPQEWPQEAPGRGVAPGGRTEGGARNLHLAALG